jgi:hypothetical protein
MPRKRYKPEKIVAKLRQVDVLVSQGDLTAFLYQRDRDYCIGMISSRW